MFIHTVLPFIKIQQSWHFCCFSCLSLCIYKRSSVCCCITHYHWHSETVCQTQSQLSLVLVQGEVWVQLRESQDPLDHKAFTQQTHKLALIIIISICLLLRLCHSTLHLRLMGSKKTDGGLRNLSETWLASPSNISPMFI